MGVDLGCSYTFVAQHLLYRPEVCSPLDEVRRKRMPERMWADAFLYPCSFNKIFNDQKYHNT